jgi:hypothetical protein
MTVVWEPMVSVRMVDDDNGMPVARVMFSDVALTLQPEQISFAAGVLRIAIPATITAPEKTTVVERWLPPTVEQVRLSVESLEAGVIERLMLREQVTSADGSWGEIARKAVALAVTGDRGE